MPRYPLGAVETIRRAARAKAEAELARADAELRRACERAQAADRLLQEHVGRRPRIDAGRSRVDALELQRAAAFERRHREQSERLRQDLSGARARVLELEQALLRAQKNLSEALAGEQVVERDHERFLDAERRERERSEQDEQDERVRR
jgi:hypothetical protein